MAVDNARKRLSAIFPTLPWRSLLPFPDGAVDYRGGSSDFQSLAWLYSGILAADPTPPPVGIGPPPVASPSRSQIVISPSRGLVASRPL